jgi:hypothetical protein
MYYIVRMSEKPIIISIKGKVAYEDEITVAQAARIITFLNAEGESNASLGPGPGQGLGEPGAADSKKSGDGVASAREALDLSGAKTNPEKIVALGQYVLQDGGDTFKVEDVKAQFRRARESAPGNFSRDLGTALREGWLAEGDGGEYYVTNKIKGIFDGDFKFPKSTTSGSGRGRATARAAKAKPDVFAGIDEFPTLMDGLASYSKMKSDKDRLLWALHFAKDRGIKGLVNKDLAWLTDHLGAGVPSGHISGAVRSAKSAGYLNRSTVDQTLRITEDGEIYLKSVGTAES